MRDAGHISEVSEPVSDFRGLTSSGTDRLVTHLLSLTLCVTHRTSTGLSADCRAIQVRSFEGPPTPVCILELEILGRLSAAAAVQLSSP